MKCPKCKKGRLRQQVSVFVECDADNTKLSKTALRSADVQVLGAGCPTAVIFCPACGHSIRLSGENTRGKKTR